MSVILCILDGWGIGPSSKYNAIYQANTPHYDRLIKKFPSALISTSGRDVGLPDGQMGNSEVGHMTIGSGRIIDQDLVRVSKALDNLDDNANVQNFITNLKRVHILGLLSDGGVHAHSDHIYKIAEYLIKKNIDVAIHAFLDGRDTPPRSALRFVHPLYEDRIKTICGRYYAMDRDNNWGRTKSAYDLIVSGISENRFDSLESAINYFYASNVTDEFIPTTIIGDYAGIKEGDGILIANFRADRIRQITSELIRNKYPQILTMTQYFDDLRLPTILPKQRVINTLGELVSNSGIKQLRIAETEKYAHVTYFFNCGRESLLENEEQVLVDSPSVKTYNMKPEMSAEKITEKLIPKMLSKEFDLIILNYANADMVGHTGDLQATIKAIETVDRCLEKVLNAAMVTNSTLIITADHGNAECMYDDRNKMPHTAHTTNYVPLIIVSDSVKKINNGRLSDLAPTILEILNIKKPAEMSGNNLIIA